MQPISNLRSTCLVDRNRVAEKTSAFLKKKKKIILYSDSKNSFLG